MVMDEENKHSTFKIYTDMIEGKMFIKYHNQKYYIKLADYSQEFLNRQSIMKSLESVFPSHTYRTREKDNLR